MLIFVEQLKSGEYHYSFFDSVRQIFDYDTLLHALHFQVPEEQLKKVNVEDEAQAWRKELKVGDTVDAIQDEILKCAGWCQARISQVAGDTL